MRLQQYINEIFSSRTEYDMIEDTNRYLSYSFNVDDDTFVVTLTKSFLFKDILSPLKIKDNTFKDLEEKFGKGILKKTVYEIEFVIWNEEKRESKYSVTGKFGNKSPKIFGYIVNIIQDAMNERNIKYLLFTSNKDEKSRSRLYKRMAIRFGKKYSIIDDDSEYTIFLIEV